MRARVSELSRGHTGRGPVLPGMRVRARGRAVVRRRPQGRDDRLLGPVRLDRARGAPRRRDVPPRDREVLPLDERGDRAARRSRREVHRRCGHGRVRRPCRARGRRAARGAGGGRPPPRARRAQRGARPRLRGHPPVPHRREHRGGDRRPPLAPAWVRQRRHGQRGRPPRAGGGARRDPHRRADARSRQARGHRGTAPAARAQGQVAAGAGLPARRRRRRHPVHRPGILRAPRRPRARAAARRRRLRARTRPARL